MKNLDSIFEPESVAIIGASREMNKIGNVITKNFVDGGFGGKVYPVNPKADEILGLKCYASIEDVPGKVDSVVIAIPAKSVPEALRQCGEKGTKGVVVISGGFAEVGNYKLEQELVEVSKKYEINVIGPNCMGILNPSSHVDSIFLPTYKLGRPHVGNISFISQSGAIGGCIVDLAARAGIGMSKFVSYGNASVVDETDLLEYLAQDKKTGVIVAYLEGVKRGREFMKIAKKVTREKPVIALKAGVSERGAKAAKSHTAALAGSAQTYLALFRQCKIIQAKTLNDLFDYAKVFEQPFPKGKRIAVITNGGGSGVLAADSVEEQELEFAKFSAETMETLRNNLPPYANVNNPLDIIGDADAERYEIAINTVVSDPGVDLLVVIVLFQTAAVDSRVVNVILAANEKSKKPFVVVSTGGEYTEMHMRILDSYDVPTYPSPSSAMRAVSKLIEYSLKIKGK